MVGIEVQPGLHQVAVKNRELNDCGNVEFLHGDIKTEVRSLRKSRFHVIASNPPYTREGSGRESPNDSRHLARHESGLDLPTLLASASSLLSRKGRLYLIYPSRRLGELLYHAQLHRLQPKRLRFIHPRKEEESNLFLLEAQKEGGIGTVVEKPLCIYDGGDYSEEVRSYYSLKG